MEQMQEAVIETAKAVRELTLKEAEQKRRDDAIQMEKLARMIEELRF